MTAFIMPLSFAKPPLNLNQRLHWAAKAKLTAQIRAEVLTRARSMKLPKGCGRIAVSFHYQPKDNRRRDRDNLVATMKPAIDALTEGTMKHPGYGMVADDTPDQMVSYMPIIHPAVKGERGKCWLEIEVLS